MEVKGVEALKEQLAQFERDILESITAELVRIGRTVETSEWRYIPFIESAQPYIDTIRLDENGIPTCDVSFSDIDEKDLSSFFFDGEIDSWNMISLLEFLKETTDGDQTDKDK